jgi:4-phospho-D-threonate 3-dehydrogenase / 4-phospho-D-erythronate 3-dehydrogenase
MPDARPVIAITIGDAAGIGPEVVVKALLSPEVYRLCRPLVIGAAPAVEATLRLIKEPPAVRKVSGPREAEGARGTIDLLDMKNLAQADIVYGKISAPCGRASMEFIDKAARLASAGDVTAIVTSPINKEATALAGYTDVGHLEYLARITGSKQYATMLVSGTLRAVHLTTHHSVAEACRLVTKERVLARLVLTDTSFRSWGFTRPRIGVAALNPHGGEGGMMGTEEIEQITPAVREAVSRGVDARGPYPADSIFNRAIAGEFDAVLAMYHDQGHIAIKVHGFEQSVSVALGLPFIRTSVDHGTAFDIAGKGIADAKGMEEAIKVAVSLSEKGRLS